MIREYYETLEEKILSPYAAFSKDSKGRIYSIPKCDIRTEYQRDRDRVLHCKSFRRLKHKTQVFIAPEGDHYRTRLTHTLEVAQIARTIARALRLNEDLTEAIGLAHDLGHTPFGHIGERCLDKITATGFKHNEQSLRVVDTLENGVGLNLTWEVRDGIVNHTSSGHPSTLEGEIVSLADRIAYINHDIDDALRAGIISVQDLPQDTIEILGDSHGKRINTMITDIVKQSEGKPQVKMSVEVTWATEALREFMFNHVYLTSDAKMEEEKAYQVIEQLFRYYKQHLNSLPQEYMEQVRIFGEEQVVCDYIAGMTDRFVIKTYQQHFIPSPWRRF